MVGPKSFVYFLEKANCAWGQSRCALMISCLGMKSHKDKFPFASSCILGDVSLWNASPSGPGTGFAKVGVGNSIPCRKAPRLTAHWTYPPQLRMSRPAQPCQCSIKPGSMHSIGKESGKLPTRLFSHQKDMCPLLPFWEISTSL